MLVERLGDALGDPPVHLALSEQRVDELASVVDGDDALQRDLARLGVDLDYGNVGTGRKRRHLGLKVDELAERLATGGDGVQCDSRAASNMESAYLGIEHDIFHRRLEQLGRTLARRFHQLRSRAGDGCASELDRPRADGEATTRHGVDPLNTRIRPSANSSTAPYSPPGPPAVTST